LNSGIGSSSVNFERIKLSPEIRRGEFSPAMGVRQSVCIAIFRIALRPASNAIQLAPMLRWRSTMRELSAEARLHLYARSLSRKPGTGFHAAALYGAFAVIAAVLFGTLSVHPF
jgi:hypothetical protein